VEVEALAVIGVVLLVLGVHLLAMQRGRRWGQKLRNPATRGGALRRLMWFCVVAAVAVVAVIAWANTDGRSMNVFGWLRYGLALLVLVGFALWALRKYARPR
jgi:tryptophan-rich sensory protein